jgi:hypothetical protein
MQGELLVDQDEWDGSVLLLKKEQIRPLCKTCQVINTLAECLIY